MRKPDRNDSVEIFRSGRGGKECRALFDFIESGEKRIDVPVR